MTANLNAIAAIIEAHEPNTVGPDGICTVGCTECDWTPGSPESFSEHVARIIVDTMGEQPTCETLPDGTKVWFLNGKLHRTDGPAIEYADGGKEWWLDGRLHRVDSPAIECPDGSKAWWLNGELHRTDGPAIEYPDGSKEWWLHSEKVGEAEHAQRTA